MDEETFSLDEEDIGLDEEGAGGEPPYRPFQRRLLRRLAAAFGTLLLVCAALLVFLYRDHLSAEGLRSLFQSGTARTQPAEPFQYENGASQSFARAGDGLAVASASGAQLFNDRGLIAASLNVPMASPAAAASKTLAVFYDVGGSACFAAGFDGSVTQLDAGQSVISASVNDSGYFTVISEEPGTKGLVRVFDPKCSPVYEWYSGSGYPLRAWVGPDDRALAALCVDTQGSVLHLFTLSSEEEKASVRYDGELLFDMKFLSSDRICAVGERGLRFAGVSGEEIARYDFGENVLGAYDFGSTGFAAVCLSEQATGGGTLVTLDRDGNILGSTETDGAVTALSAGNRRLLIATAGSLSLYSSQMELQEREETLVTAKQALLRPKGDVLLLSSYAAEIFAF